MERKEVSSAKFRRLVAKEEDLAYNMINKINKSSCISWFFSDNEAFKYVTRPCIYQENSGYNTWCPETSKWIRSRPIPKNLKEVVKNGVTYLRHASDVTCPHIRMGQTVRCYAIIDGKHLICEHKVGQCPHKRRIK